MKTLVSILSFAMAALAAFPALADAAAGYGPYHSMMMGGWFMGPFMMVIFLVLLAAAAIFLMRTFGVMPKESPDRALAILRERFAKGEIDRAEFEERRKLLE